MRRITGGTQLPFEMVGSSKFSKYPKVNAEKTYNMFISDGALINSPGYAKARQLLELGEGRAIYNSTRGNFMIVVVSSNVYRVQNTNLTSVLLGTISTASGEVYVAENLNNQICIVDGLNIYIYDHSGAPSLTAQSGLPVDFIPNHVCYHNTFFLFGNGNRTSSGAAWYAFEYATSTTIQLAKTLALQTKPDQAIAIKRIPGQSNNVIVFGRNVCEVHSQVGGVENYRRNSSVSIDYGCLAVETIAVSGDYVMWVGTNQRNAPSLMVFDGQGAFEISTDGISDALKNLKHPEMSTATFHTEFGHLQYIVTFYHEDDNVSFMYDLKTKLFFNLSDQKTNYFPARQIAYFNNKTYFVALNNGSIYELSSEFTTYDENIIGDALPDPRINHEIPRIRICDTIRLPNNEPFRVGSITFTMDMGNDNLPPNMDCLEFIITEDGDFVISEDGPPYYYHVPEDAGEEDCLSTQYQGRVDLALSGNGGETYSNYVPRFTNPVGKRRNIIHWENLGSFNEFTPKFRFWTKGRVIVFGGVVETF